MPFQVPHVVESRLKGWDCGAIMIAADVACALEGFGEYRTLIGFLSTQSKRHSLLLSHHNIDLYDTVIYFVASVMGTVQYSARESLPRPEQPELRRTKSCSSSPGGVCGCEAECGIFYSLKFR